MKLPKRDFMHTKWALSLSRSLSSHWSLSSLPFSHVLVLQRKLNRESEEEDGWSYLCELTRAGAWSVEVGHVREERGRKERLKKENEIKEGGREKNRDGEYCKII